MKSPESLRSMDCSLPSLSMGLSRQEYWSVLPFPFPGDLPDPGINPRSPALQADALPLSRQGPNCSGGDEDNGNLLQEVPCMHCCTQCPPPFSSPPPTHASAGDSWTLTGKSGSVSCADTASFSWISLSHHEASISLLSLSIRGQTE